MSSPAFEDIVDFFNEYVFGFMYHDINAGINGDANFLTALGLVAYTEFFGKLLTGETFGTVVTGKTKRRVKNEEKFNSFLFDYFPNGNYYKRLGVECKNIALGSLYDIVRNGLAHEYFIKNGNFTIRMYGIKGKPYAMYLTKGIHLNFVVVKYFDEFKEGVLRYYNSLLSGSDANLSSNFRKVIMTIL